MTFDLNGYVDVAERIRIFREKYPNGSLQPLDHAKPYDVINIGERMFVTYVAAAYRTPDDPRPGIGVAWEPFPGRSNFTKDSELMDAETSAWGRAIIAALAADTQKIASAEEVRNRRDDEPAGNVVPMRPEPHGLATPRSYQHDKPARPDSGSHPAKPKPSATSVNITEAQVKLLNKLAKEKNYDAVNFASISAGRQLDSLNALTKKEASSAITELMNAEPVI